MSLDNNQEVFFELLRAGLFPVHDEGVMVHDSLFMDVDWGEVYQIAQEQSVLGIVLQGIEELRAKGIELSVPKVLLLQWIGEVQMIEQRNKAMNGFLAKLIELLRKEDVYAILVKGQGIAQCYERPLWRSSGDVDLFLSSENYKRASDYLYKTASSVDEENSRNLHLAMSIDSWEVELHGTLRCGLWKGMDRGLDEIQHTIFCDGKVRSWMNGSIQVFLPNADEDIVYVFAHILQHFFFEGVGLRQISDWCRLLWTYRGKIDIKLLQYRLFALGIETEWKTFAALAVDYLGMPEEAMPFYSSSKRWKKSSERVLSFVLETGNMGHSRDWTYFKKYPYLIRKAISLGRHAWDHVRYSMIFPLDSIKVWNSMVIRGINVAVKGK